jgi:hypothetical protein
MNEKTMLVLTAIIAVLYMGFMYRFFNPKQQPHDE